MINVIYTIKTTSFSNEIKGFKKTKSYWDDKNFKEIALKQIVVDIITDETDELNNVKKMEISFSVKKSTNNELNDEDELN